jgi:hypothetical protein
MTDEDRLRQLIQDEFEKLIREHCWPEKAVQEALIRVAKEHLWRQGLMIRLRYWANIIGVLGIIGGGLLFLASLLGFEVARK